MICEKTYWLTSYLGEQVMYQDETLICEDCGKEFIFTVGEQEFYAEKGLTNKPKRCADCRKVKKQQHRNKKRTVCPLVIIKDRQFIIF